MAQIQAEQRFFSSTRGRIVTLLRRAGRTVEELAQELDLTGNAVRAHLAALERDGLVRLGGARRAGGKPAQVYELSSAAERLFPKAHAPVLDALLTELDSRLDPRELSELARAVGRRLAAEGPPLAGNFDDRLAAALTSLTELGGLVESEEAGDSVLLCGYRCPLAGVMPGHPELCDVIAALLAGRLGVPVEQQCAAGPTAQCRFVVDRDAA
jgi:predicted ArsR family transcriptional regulator